MASRTDFDELPSALRAAVASHVGRIHRVEPVSAGLNSQIAARLHCDAGTVHVKGLRTDHRWAWTQEREAEVNPYLKGISPELLWRVKESGWDLLGFAHIKGHHADYSHGSQDLPLMVGLLIGLSETECPPIELREAGQRLRKYVDDVSQSDLFVGNLLLHTDLNNENVLIQENRAYMVDWAWATRGAPWLDAAYWVIWLMAAGEHSPQSAEQWAEQVPAWESASREALSVFALANQRMWAEIGGDSPDSWTSRMMSASETWSEYRQSL
ncbi:aminoglycoside phosphotransferase [Streptomyces sp. NPDC102462]|uniref:aminoglycoside phosphotransferase n=1 Tax=Streptomyces sp. NPDC102462 TaxID=3366178 RepID=UPI0038125070